MILNDIAHSDSDEIDRGAYYRHKKFTVTNRSVPVNGLDLRAGASSPVEMWRPRNSQPVFGENQPAFGLYDRHPQAGTSRDFVPLPVVQPPPRANVNPFSMANMPQQRYVPQDVGTPGPSHQQQPHPVPGPSPAQRIASPRHDFSEYNQF